MGTQGGVPRDGPASKDAVRHVALYTYGIEPGWPDELDLAGQVSQQEEVPARRLDLLARPAKQVRLPHSSLALRIVINYAHAVSGHTNRNDMWREFAERILRPLFDYLDERIGAESSMLYTLERYVRRVEWFERDDLYQRYLADRQNGEAVYDLDLRKFLFSEGINMPFSQAKSASGLSDVLTDLDTDDPFIGEVKLFDAVNHGKRELATGVNQAILYAQDWVKTTGYLVAVNLSGRQLELPTDDPKGTWPPYLEVGGVRVHLITVRALPTPTASQQGKPRPVSFTRENLVNPDA